MLSSGSKILKALYIYNSYNDTNNSLTEIKNNEDIWGVDNRKGPNYQNCNFELMAFLYVICHED